MINNTVFLWKERVLEIMTGRTSSDYKEKALRQQFSTFYRFVLNHWFTLLRRSDYTIEYSVRLFSIEESRKVFMTNPKNLSMNEMFLLALTCAPGNEEYNRIFMTAVTLYPDSAVANLNAACIVLTRKNIWETVRYLKKVPETKLAKGILLILQNKYEEAEKLLKQAKSAGLSQADDYLNQLDELK